MKRKNKSLNASYLVAIFVLILSFGILFIKTQQIKARNTSSCSAEKQPKDVCGLQRNEAIIKKWLSN